MVALVRDKAQKKKGRAIGTTLFGNLLSQA